MAKNLKKILEKGDTIELQSDKTHSVLSIESSLSEVLSDRKIRVKARKDIFSQPIKRQQEFIVTAKKEVGMIQMQATVQEVIETASEVTMILDVHTNIEQIQRREYFRLSLLKEIAVNLLGDPPIKGITQNISAGGIKCYVSSEIRSGATIQVHLDIEPTPLVLRGKVLECAPLPDSISHTLLRIQFIELEPKEQRTLTAYILKQQGKREAKLKR